MLLRRFFVLVLLTFFTLGSVNGQKVKQMFFDTPGLQVGMYQGYTQFNDAGLNYYFRLYNKHSFRPYRFGEFSISSGIISGLGYRSQLTPIEYRFGQHFSRLFNSPEPMLFGRRTHLYVYAGAGILYNRPLEVVAPDDPLTVEMGNGLPTSSFWDFDGGFAPFIPIGFGLEIPLDLGASLNISTGYNQTLSMLKFNSNDVPKGFWGLSIGIDFQKQKPAPLPPPRIPVFKKMERKPMPKVPVQSVNIEPVNNSNGLLNRLNDETINFDILSSELDDTARKRLAEAAFILKQNPKRPLQVYGHADSIGTEAVNRMISESRARAVWLALIENGVDGSRLNYSWYSDDRPLESNATKEGRLENRRVEFRTVPPGAKFIERPSKDEVYIVPILKDYEFDKPFFDGLKINFSKTMLGLDEGSKSFITVVSYLMILQPELEVVVLNQVDARAGTDLRTSLAKARADLIKAELLMKGIEADRVHVAAPGSELYERYSDHFRGADQQNLLIPVRPSFPEPKESGVIG